MKVAGDMTRVQGRVLDPPKVPGCARARVCVCVGSAAVCVFADWLIGSGGR